MSDILERIHERRRQDILRTGASFNEFDIYCPYCAIEQREIWEWDLTANEEEREAQCYNCRRYFFYSVRLCFDTRRQK